MELAAAKAISARYGCAVLCKGGHQLNDADDLLWRRRRGAVVPRQADRTTPTPTAPAAPSPAPLRRIWPRALRSGYRRGAGEGVHLRRAGRHAGSGQGLRPHEPRRFAPACCRGGVYEMEKTTSTFQNGLIWFGAGGVSGGNPDRHVLCPAGHGSGHGGHCAGAPHRLRHAVPGGAHRRPLRAAAPWRR